jgi:hypothetical protein
MEETKQVEMFPQTLPKKRGRPRKNPLPEVKTVAPVAAPKPAEETLDKESIRKLAVFLDYWKKELPGLSTEALLRIYAHITT